MESKMKIFDMTMLTSFFGDDIYKFLDKNLGNDAYYVGLIILSSLWITGAIMISIMFSGNKNKIRVMTPTY